MSSTRGDILVAALKAILGPVPFVGSALGEIAGIVTPDQKIHILERRIDDVLYILQNKLPILNNIRQHFVSSEYFVRLQERISYSDCDLNIIVDELLKKQNADYELLDRREKHDFINRLLNRATRLHLSNVTIDMIIELSLAEFSNTTPELQMMLETPGSGFHSLGYLLSLRGRHYDAINAYMHAIEYGCADEHICLMNIANSFESLGLTDIAMRGYEFVLYRFPFHLLPHIYLARNALNKNDHELANDHYKHYAVQFDQRLSEGAIFPEKSVVMRKEAEAFLSGQSLVNCSSH